MALSCDCVLSVPLSSAPTETNSLMDETFDSFFYQEECALC